MKSATPKVLHSVAGRRMLDHVLAAAEALTPASVTVVVGHEGDRVREAYAGGQARFVVQEPQLGTGHALLQAEPLLRDATGTVVLLSGDVPLLGAPTLKRLVAQHQADAAAATVLTATVHNPHGYGRIVREAGRIARIVEERDASPGEQAIAEINSGIYALDLAPLFDAVRGIASQNAQGEYYLPDLVGIYRQRGLAVSTVSVSNPDEIRGINSRRELAEVGAIVRHTKNEELMAAGVTLVDPATTYIEPGVVVGADTVIHPNVYLEGRTVIGEGCEIHAGTRIVDSTIGDRVLIRNYCVITESSVATRAVLGPFAHLRPASHVLDGRTRRQLRRAEEDDARAGIEGQPPDVSRRRDDRRRREHRRGHHHVQLRRQDQERDRDRGRRLHRQRLGPGRARHHRPRRLRRGGVDDHRKRARKRAGNRTQSPGQQRGLGQEAVIAYVGPSFSSGEKTKARRPS